MSTISTAIHGRHQLKFYAAVAGILALGVLVGASSARSAHAATPQSYTVMVGASGGANTDLLQFAPGALKVHRGDTITWANSGFHNIHVGASRPADLVIAPEVNGKPLPQFNPQIVFPYGAKSGTAYQGGETGSGVPLGPTDSPLFSLVIDAAPGTTIPVLCDIHPGMASNITVVADSEAIPSPTEVTLQAAGEFGASIGAATQAYAKLAADSATKMASSGGTASVQMGSDVGRAATELFFPYATVIKAGESVTWKFGDGAIEPHTVTMPPMVGQDFVPIPQEGKPPIISLGPGFVPMTQSGATVKNGDKFSSGTMLPTPGNVPTFTLTFADPGVYPYVCNIHAGMNGVVVVTAK